MATDAASDAKILRRKGADNFSAAFRLERQLNKIMSGPAEELT